MAVLLGLAVFELVFAVRAKKQVHSLRDTTSSIAMGIGQQTLNLYLAGLFLALYAFVHAHAPFAKSSGTWWHWVILVFGCDLAFYTGHRTAHSVNLFVAGHVPHHQAEDFNLLSSMRQGWVAWVQMFPFYLPLAALGFPIEMLIEAQIGVMCFQFLSHYGATSMRLGILDKIFVTPRNHRVHHGYGRKYGGKNCGGMFVIWDRLFGSFAEEEEIDPVKIGSGFAVNFHDPVEAHVDYYRRIAFVAKHRRGLGKLTIWFQSPGTLLRELARLDYEPSALNRAPVTPLDARWIVAWAVVCLGVFVVHRALFEKSGTPLRIATGAATIGALFVLGRFLSGWRPLARRELTAESAPAPERAA